MDAHEEHVTPVWQLVAAAVMLVLGMTAGEYLANYFKVEFPLHVWYALTLLLAGFNVLRNTVKAVGEGDFFNELTLMSVAAIGAFLIGEHAEAAVVLLLYEIGERLQDRAVDRARDNIKSLMAFRPDHAWVVKGAEVERHNPSDVSVGSIIEVRPGERVPIDGVLLTDEADFDTAALTGESMPRMIASGEEVLSGMIAIGHVVRLKTSRTVADSAVSRILNMVENATERKAPTEQFIRRFARIYTPTVFGLAILVVLVPLFCHLVGFTHDYDFAEWIRRSLIFLVIACPCALVISVPLSYFAGIGAASKRGILFKGGNTLDAMIDLDTVAFDKTGTLTTGHFAVSKVIDLTAEELATVAAMEQMSSHPVAVAITEYAKQQGVTASIGDTESISGYGLKSDEWLVGAIRLLDKYGVAVPEELRRVEDTIVAVAHKGVYRGCILLADTPKDDAADAIKALHRRTVILSGDKQTLVDRLKETLGADEGYGDLLPEDKVRHIEELQQRHHKVAFVGDGINDAPVLALSDVGIAMGSGGADMAVETADVVIVGDKPSKVADAIGIAANTRRIVAQNITMAIGFKLCFMILGIAGIANIWMAVFADTGVTLLAVLNSLRIFKATKE